MLDVAENLAAIVNTGDDTVVYGAHVSPDPDLVTWWLADAIDARGYGLAGDTFSVMEAFAAAGSETWFRLGDRDLTLCLLRTALLRAGEPLTAAHAAVVAAMEVGARVLPMTDEPVRTLVTARGAERPFQEFMILEGAAGPIEAVEFEGAAEARPTHEVLETLAHADAIVIGPSNPIASIGPILALPGMRDALVAAAAPVVAVSPFVGGEVLKGPTLAFCRHAGIEASPRGLLEAYSGLLDGVVADEPVEGVPALTTRVLMDTPAARARVARETLDFAALLARR
jgi:LPPG:FO 2-phospho-L-lactate transferase